MISITATIGRNIGNTPMNDDAWVTFRKQVHYAMKETFGTSFEDVSAYEAHDGIGTWDGVQEESHKYTALLHTSWTADNFPALTRHIPILRDRLRQLAQDHGQDAIALTIGATELLTA